MISLIMDTSHQYLVVALYEDGKCLESIQELGSKRQSENAIPYLEKLLHKHQKELMNIDEMIITRGPGSYTGVRVAMTIAKTLSVISPLKIKAISSLQAYIGEGTGVSVIDARSQKIFVCVYQNGQPLIPEQMIPIQDFETFMKDYPNYPVKGQCDIVEYPIEDINFAQNIYDLSLHQEPVEHVDALVPRYIKDVEAKKICS